MKNMRQFAGLLGLTLVAACGQSPTTSVEAVAPRFEGGGGYTLGGGNYSGGSGTTTSGASSTLPCTSEEEGGGYTLGGGNAISEPCTDPQ